MKVSLIGLGVLGSTIAECLLKQSVDVSVIALGKIGQKIKSDGMIVNGIKYGVKVSEKGDKAPDLLFVTVKNYHLEQALNDVEDFIDNNTIILPLLNSVSPTPIIKQRYPNNHVLYGYIQKVDTFLEGKEYKYNIQGELHFGDANNEKVNPKLLPIQEMLSNAGFGGFIDKDMVRGIWKKWMLNVGANQVSALTGANYVQFSKIPEIKQILRLAMQELMILAGYEGVHICTKDVDDTIAYLTTYKFPKKTSMLQDIEAKRKTEIDYISGDIIKLSKKWNCPCPVNLTMYCLIKSKEKAYLNEY